MTGKVTLCLLHSDNTVAVYIMSPKSSVKRNIFIHEYHLQAAG